MAAIGFSAGQGSPFYIHSALNEVPLLLNLAYPLSNNLFRGLFFYMTVYFLVMAQYMPHTGTEIS